MTPIRPPVPQAVVLCFKDNGFHRAKRLRLAMDYWETDCNGKFVHTSADLMRRYDYGSQASMLEAIATAASAHVADQRFTDRCPTCDTPMALRARTWPREARYCPDCNAWCPPKGTWAYQRQLRYQIRLARYGEDRALKLRELDTVACLRLRALHRCLGDRLLAGERFTMAQCNTPEIALRWVDLESLRGCGAVHATVKRDGTIDGFELDEFGRLSVKSWITDLLPAKIENGSWHDALAYAQGRPIDAVNDVLDLWTEHMTWRCLDYLYVGLEAYQLPVPERSWRFERQVKDALTSLSPAQVMDLIWHALEHSVINPKITSSIGLADHFFTMKMEDFLRWVRNGMRRLPPRPAGQGPRPDALSAVFAEQFGVDEQMLLGEASWRIQGKSIAAKLAAKRGRM